METATEAKQSKKAAHRADPPVEDVQARPEIDRLFSYDPDYRYENVFPHNVAQMTRPRTLATNERFAGFEIVRDDSDVVLGRQRDDSGSPLDTALRQGRFIVMRCKLTEYAKIEREEAEKVAGRARGLSSREDQAFGSVGGKPAATIHGSVELSQE